MIILNNIFECSGCHMRIIDEERSIHKCRRPKGFHIKYDILWLSDGITEYPLKLSKIRKHNQPTFDSNKNNRRLYRTKLQETFDKIRKFQKKQDG